MPGPDLHESAAVAGDRTKLVVRTCCKVRTFKLARPEVSLIMIMYVYIYIYICIICFGIAFSNLSPIRSKTSGDRRYQAIAYSDFVVQGPDKPTFCISSCSSGLKPFAKSANGGFPNSIGCDAKMSGSELPL